MYGWPRRGATRNQSTKIVLVKKIFKNETCSTFDKDTVQCISEQLSNFEPKLDYQFDNKYTFQSVLIACIDLFGGPLNNSKKIQINYIKIRISDLELAITPS